MGNNQHKPDALLPVIDFGNFLVDPTSPGGQACAQALREACHNPGFCYLANHGIDARLEQDVIDISHRFFDLPVSDRLAIKNTKSAQFRGYTQLGMEITNNTQDWRDQIDFGPEKETVNLGPDDPQWLKLHGPNQWPPALPTMQDIISSWLGCMASLGTSVLSALAVGLGQEPDYFDYMAGDEPEFLMKVIRYPHVENDQDSEQGVGLHQDSGLITLILQNEVPGLEVGLGDDIVPVKQIPGTYIMNLGEMLQMATHGYLRATKHRVIMPPPGLERISLAYFVNPALEANIVPISLPPDLMTQAPGGENPNPDDPVFSVYGANKLKFRVRSHPDVAAIHYSDLV
jgi:isopenicillin N synthase-like dioxygenase